MTKTFKAEDYEDYETDGEDYDLEDDERMTAEDVIDFLQSMQMDDVWEQPCSGRLSCVCQRCR